VSKPPSPTSKGDKPLEENISNKQFYRAPYVRKEIPTKEKLHAAAPIEFGRRSLYPNRIPVSNSKNGEYSPDKVCYQGGIKVLKVSRTHKNKDNCKYRSNYSFD